jgi:hypothetical protein
MNFKVDIQKVDTNTIKGFIFSIIHPDNGKYIYEFFDRYEHLGKLHCQEIVDDINRGLELLKIEKIESGGSDA